MNMFKTTEEILDELYEGGYYYSIDQIMEALEALEELEKKYQVNVEDKIELENELDIDIECDGDCEHCKYGHEDNSDEYEYGNIYGDEDNIAYGDELAKAYKRAQEEFDKSMNEYDKHMAEAVEEYDAVSRPYHYASHGIETIDKIEAVIDGLPAKKAALLANVIKYVDRAGLKDDAKKDLDKANAYAHRLVYGHWRKR